MTGPRGVPDELAAIAADDRVFDALADGRRTEFSEAVTTLLVDWRGELDRAVRTAPSLQTMPAPRARWSRTRRHATFAAVAALTLAVSTGVAAAAGGVTGPLGALHRALFGSAARTSAARDAASEARIALILDDVARSVRAARAAGGISDANRVGLDRLLDRAAAMIANDRDAFRSLQKRLDALRALLAALPSLVTPATVPTAVPPADRHDGSRPGVSDMSSRARDGGNDGAVPQSTDSGRQDTSSSGTTSGDSTPSSNGSGSGDVAGSPQPTATSGDGYPEGASSDSASSDS